MSLDKGITIPITEQPISIPKTDLSEPLSHGTLIRQNESLMHYLGTSLAIDENTRIGTGDEGEFFHITRKGKSIATVQGDIRKFARLRAAPRQTLEVIISQYTKAEWSSREMLIPLDEFFHARGLQGGRDAINTLKECASYLSGLYLPCKRLYRGEWKEFKNFQNVIAVDISTDNSTMITAWGEAYFDYERYSMGDMYIPTLAQTIHGRYQSRGERAHDVLIFASLHKHLQTATKGGRVFDGRQLDDILTGKQFIDEAAHITDVKTAQREAKAQRAAKGRSRATNRIKAQTVEPVADVIIDTRPAIIFIAFDETNGEAYTGEELAKQATPNEMKKLKFYAHWREHSHGGKDFADGRLKTIDIDEKLLSKIDERIEEELSKDSKQ